jgi:hypothetical protein
VNLSQEIAFNLFQTGAIIIAILVFLFDGLSFLYDYRLSEKGIEFLLFRKIPVGLIEFSELEEARTARPWSSFFNSLNLTNRFRNVLKPILIIKKSGFFFKALLLTPSNSEEFLARINFYLQAE